MPERLPRRGMMFVLSSPSGGGKTTLARLLLQNDADIRLSVSCTTRPPRPDEREGKDYYFLDKSVFDARRKSGYFYESAEVFGNDYGTPKGPVEEELAAGRDVLFDIDWQGTRRLTEQARDEIVSVFILPPSLAELRRRLEARGQDAREVIERRMARACGEIRHWEEYDYVLINGSIDACLQNILHILHSERLKRKRNIGIEAAVKALLNEECHK